MKPKIIIDESLADKPVELAYHPREHQAEVHRQMRRFNVILCHRRFGKTVMAINTLIDKAVRATTPMPRFAYVGPNYGQVKRVVWDYFKEFTKHIPGVTYNESELRLDFLHNNARIMCLSAENPMALKGIYLDWGTLDEYGDINPIVWREVIRPTLIDRQGGMLFIGTVKGRNHFWELFDSKRDLSDPEWFAAMYKASETGIIPQKELDLARASMTEEEYEQEFECDPLAGNVGAYFAREMGKVERVGGISQIPYEPTVLVDTSWDLGINDVTAIWFYQTIRGHHRFIDYYEVSGHSIPEIAQTLKDKRYRYGTVHLPHDANARDLSTGKTTAQLLYAEGFKRLKVIPKVKQKRLSINAAKMALPHCSFDREKCDRGIKALQQYKRKWDEKTQSFADHPLHDWSSNGADAFQQFALGNQHETGQNERIDQDFVPANLQEAETEYDPYARVDDGWH
jgi:phage terminase large subunit